MKIACVGVLTIIALSLFQIRRVESLSFSSFSLLGTATSSVATEQVVSNCDAFLFCLVLRNARLESLLRPLLFRLGLLLVLHSYHRLKLYIYIFLQLIFIFEQFYQSLQNGYKSGQFQFSVLRCSMFFFPWYYFFYGLYQPLCNTNVVFVSFCNTVHYFWQQLFNYINPSSAK